MPQFDASTYSSQIFWLLFCILFLIIFLKKTLLPRIDHIFQTRYYHFYEERKKLKHLQEKISFFKKNKAAKLQKAKEDVNDQIKQVKIALEIERELYLQKIDNDMQAEILEFEIRLHHEMQESQNIQEFYTKEYVGLIQEKILKQDAFQGKI
jgi:F-type H+-transporting ATPase subunit b